MYSYSLLVLYTVMLYLANCRPQHNESPRWRTQLASANDNNGYQPFQRYNQEYENVEIPSRVSTAYNSNFGTRITIKRMSTQSRIRGPAREMMIPEKHAKIYEQNEYDELGPNQAAAAAASSEYNDTVPQTTKKLSTRILNHRKHIPSHDVMLGDQPTDFVFPGRVNSSPTTATTTTTTDRVRVQVNPFIPDLNIAKPRCKGEASTFCENVDYYPTAHVNAVLNQAVSNYSSLLGVDEIATNVSIGTRIGGPDDTPMCRSKEHVVEPKVALNKDDKWMYIINQDQFVQGIRVEICENESEKCSMSEIFPLIYTTECKQKYIYRKMLALNYDGKPIPDKFKIPSCCLCFVKNIMSSKN